MKTLRIFRILSMLLIVFTTLAAANPAYAGGDTHHRVFIPFSEELLWLAADNPCQSFDILVQDDGYILVNYWTDEYGQLTRELDIMFNAHRIVTVGDNVISGHTNGPILYEVTRPSEDVLVVEMSTRGTASLLTAPGYGKIWGGAGFLNDTTTYIWNTTTGDWEEVSYIINKEVGNHDYEEWGDFCEYLGS